MRVVRGGRYFKVDVAPDGEGWCRTRARLCWLRSLTGGLTRELSRALAAMRERRCKHDPGRVIRDLASRATGTPEGDPHRQRPPSRAATRQPTPTRPGIPFPDMLPIETRRMELRGARHGGFS